MNKPIMRDDGRCSECIGGLCEYHKAETNKRWMDKEKMLRQVALHIRLERAGRIAASEAMESDEAGTAIEKAMRIMDGENPIPRHMMISGV